VHEKNSDGNFIFLNDFNCDTDIERFGF